MKTIYSDVLLQTNGIIVHGCNMQGVMGAGIARAIKQRFPSAYNVYIDGLNNGKQLGDICLTEITDQLYIANALTQRFYGNSEITHQVYVDYVALKTCFEEVNQLALITKLPVLFPKIGCGLAGGNWNTVCKIIETALDPKVERTLYILE
jgi:O-acetyl-ADP-ribose deacetylase (regulator of RNase III)